MPHNLDTLLPRFDTLTPTYLDTRFKLPWTFPPRPLLRSTRPRLLVYVCLILMYTIRVCVCVCVFLRVCWLLRSTLLWYVHYWKRLWIGCVHNLSLSPFLTRLHTCGYRLVWRSWVTLDLATMACTVLCTHVCKYVYICIYIYIYIYVFIYIYIHTYIHTYIYIYIHAWIYIFDCIMYVHMCTEIGDRWIHVAHTFMPLTQAYIHISAGLWALVLKAYNSRQPSINTNKHVHSQILTYTYLFHITLLCRARIHRSSVWGELW